MVEPRQAIRTSEGPYCLGCNYLLIGLSENRCPECGRAFDLNDPKSYRNNLRSKFSTYWLSPPGKGSKWFPLALTLGGLLSATIPGGFFIIVILEIYGWLICLSWWVFRYAVWGISNLVTDITHGQHRIALKWLMTPALFATMMVCLFLRLPLYASFFVSLPAMNRTAQQIVAAPTAQTNASWIGLYPVCRVEAVPGGMRFLVSGSGFLDPGGFAYSPNGPPPRIGEDYYRHLWGAWYEWTESW